MTRLGTPIGAGPNWATVRPGFWSVGVPSGLRSFGCWIFWRSPLAAFLAPLPFFACLPNRPPPPFLPPPALTVPPLDPPRLPEPPPAPGGLTELPTVVVAPPPELPLPPEPPESPDEVGALYSEVSLAPLQPGSAPSTRPSPSLSERSAHSGRTPPPSLGVPTVTSPAVIEVAVPAAMMAMAAPSAMVTRSFLVIAKPILPAIHWGLPIAASLHPQARRTLLIRPIPCKREPLATG